MNTRTFASGEYSMRVTLGEKDTFSIIHQGYVERQKGFMNKNFEGCQDIDVMRYAAMELLIKLFSVCA